MTRPPLKLRHLLLVTLVATTFVGDAAAECAAGPRHEAEASRAAVTARLFDKLRVGLRRSVRAAVLMVHARRDVRATPVASVAVPPDAPVVYRLLAPFLLRLPPPVR